jgi:hypothetical protein
MSAETKIRTAAYIYDAASEPLNEGNDVRIKLIDLGVRVFTGLMLDHIVEMISICDDDAEGLKRCLDTLACDVKGTWLGEHAVAILQQFGKFDLNVALAMSIKRALDHVSDTGRKRARIEIAPDYQSYAFIDAEAPSQPTKSTKTDNAPLNGASDAEILEEAQDMSESAQPATDAWGLPIKGGAK